MAFNDCFMTNAGAVSLPQEKFDRMLQGQQLVWVDTPHRHVARMLHKKIGAFREGQEVLDSSDWLQVSHVQGGRVELLQAKRPSLEEMATSLAQEPHKTKEAVANIPHTSSRTTEVTQHALERWRERVEPYLAGVQGDKKSLLAALERAVQVVRPCDHFEGKGYYRLETGAVPPGWIEFVLADDDFAPRVVTVTTQAGFDAKFPHSQRVKLSAARRSRARQLQLSTSSWDVSDPDGKTWKVAQIGPTRLSCTCPDFEFKSGPARVSCKHIWRVREEIGAAEDGEL